MNKILLSALIVFLFLFSSCEKETLSPNETDNALSSMEIESRSVSEAVNIINGLMDQVEQLYADGLITNSQKKQLLNKLKQIRKKLLQGKIDQAIDRINSLISWLESSGIDPDIASDLIEQLSTAKCQAMTENDDDVYDAIGLTEIQSAPLSTTVLDGSDNVYNEIPAGTVVVYQTNEGRYGKFVTQDVDFSLLMSWTTYNDDGTVYSSGTDLNILGTWHADLDEGVQTATNGSQDFWWEAVDGIDRFVVPTLGATFAIYSCEDTEPELCTGDYAFGDINYHDILDSTLDPSPIDGSDNANNQIPAETVVLYSTNSGRIGKMLIQEYGYSLLISWRTYNTNGVTESEGTDFVLPGTWVVDLDSGTLLGSLDGTEDVWWQQVDTVERYLTPLSSAEMAVYTCDAN